ncbi:hypothetical protein [Mucilaginibacter sp.]|uniref:hypothetical protein n=1 Tax=Mucilaginibacter sp. TaxID=1882438 RepID=UPI0025DF91A9|nr:hypothetical protein [Mucilaginibacter sp.]
MGKPLLNGAAFLREMGVMLIHSKHEGKGLCTREMYLMHGGLLRNKVFSINLLSTPLNCRGGCYFFLDKKVTKKSRQKKASALQGRLPGPLFCQAFTRLKHNVMLRQKLLPF